MASRETLQKARELRPRNCRNCGKQLPKPTFGDPTALDRSRPTTEKSEWVWFMQCTKCGTVWHTPNNSGLYVPKA